MAWFDQEYVAVPAVSCRADRQPAEHANSIDLEHVAGMIHVPRLEHQERRLARLDVRAVEDERPRPARKRHVRLDVVEDARLVSEMLPLKKDDREVRCHEWSSNRAWLVLLDDGANRA